MTKAPENTRKDPEKGQKVKRTLIEWGIILSVAGILYITGYHTEVIGSIQRILLVTGIHQPHTPAEERSDFPSADYDLTLISLNGTEVNLSDFRGRTLFINLWATWCPPCIAEMPNIQALHNKLQNENDIQFLMISLDEDPAKARQFISRKEFSFPVYFPSSGLPAAYRGAVVPRTYVISPEGKIVVSHEGMAKYNTDSFREYLLSL